MKRIADLFAASIVIYSAGVASSHLTGGDVTSTGMILVSYVFMAAGFTALMTRLASR